MSSRRRRRPCGPGQINIRRCAGCRCCGKRWRSIMGHQGLAVAPDAVTVTSGATEALAASILALVKLGDEVLLFQPLYDAYLPLVQRAGGVARLARLSPPDWRLTAEVIDEGFTERTRAGV